MDRHDEHEDDSVVRAAEDAELRISHFIPSVDLKGSRNDKLETLDTLIIDLERVRKSLAGETVVARGGFGGPGRHIGSPTWPWFAAGALLGALFLLLIILARG